MLAERFSAPASQADGAAVGSEAARTLLEAPAAEPFEYDFSRVPEWSRTERNAAVRRMKEKILGAVDVVSDEAFTTACRSAVGTARSALADVPPERRLILTGNAPEVSNRWVYDRFGSELAEPGSAASYFTAPWEKMKGFPTLEHALRGAGRTGIVVFDDMSYSGTQIRQRWLDPIDVFAKANPGSRIDVYYVCGLATKSAQEFVDTFNAQSCGVRGHLIAGKFAPLVSELLTAQERELLRTVEPEAVCRSTVTILAHKLADDYSVFNPLRDRLIHHRPTPPYKASVAPDGTEMVSRYVEHNRREFAAYKEALWNEGRACCSVISARPIPS